MSYEKVLFSKGSYRLVEVEVDPYLELENLLDGDYSEKEQKIIKDKAYREGVYVYSIEKWNSDVGVGWEDIDECGGFIGKYDEESNDHYIVKEFIYKIDQKA